MQSQTEDREKWIRILEEGLAVQPDLEPLLLEYGIALEALGRYDEARAVYERIHRDHPENFSALNNLARLLYIAGKRVDAFTLYRELVARHPQHAKAHANYGFMLLRGDDAATARIHYQKALQLEPDNVEAHRGLALVLERLNESGLAAEHFRVGFEQNPLTILPYRGEGNGIRTLLIVSATSGNCHFEQLLDDRHYAVTKILAESEANVQVLPPHELLINAVSDADIATDALQCAARIVARSNALVVNHPEDVAQTKRVEVARRLRTIQGVRTPQMQIFPRETLEGDQAATALIAAGFEFPLLLRAPGFHTGEHFARVANAAAVATAVAAIPGDELLAIEYIDTQNELGKFCKYRVLLIDGEIYPLHAATSDTWKVHYFTAQMQAAEHRTVDREFLADMTAVLGSRATYTLTDISETLGLDYAGIDFSLDEDGNIVVFEANATMVIVPASDDAASAYRKPYVDRACAAVDMLFKSRAQTLLSCV